MIRTQYTTEDLKKLPLRAIVAFAAQCAKRVEPIAQFPAGHPQQEARRVAIDDAIRLAEDISKDSACPSIDPVVRALESTRAISGVGVGCECAAAAAEAAARTAATVWLMLSPGEGDRDADRWTLTPEARSYLSHLATVTADIVSLDAFTAAVEAANAAPLTTPSCTGPSGIMRGSSASIWASIPRPDRLSTPRPMARSGHCKRSRAGDGRSIAISRGLSTIRG